MDEVRLIDAIALQRAFDKAHEGEPDFYCDNFLNNAGNPSTEWDCVDDILQSAPIIEAQPVKRGHWINHVDALFPAESTIECSVCHGHSPAYMQYDNFCPNCGTKMGGEDADN